MIFWFLKIIIKFELNNWDLISENSGFLGWRNMKVKVWWIWRCWMQTSLNESGSMMDMKGLDADFSEWKWMKNGREQDGIFVIFAKIGFIKGKFVHLCHKVWVSILVFQSTLAKSAKHSHINETMSSLKEIWKK